MTAARLTGFLLALALVLLALSGAVSAIAGNGDLLAGEMLRHAPPAATALPAAEYPGVGRMIAAYLTGKEPVFQYSFESGGNSYLCFQAHEAAHMADCRALIGTARVLCPVLGGLSLALAGAGCLLRKHRRSFGAGLLAGALAAAGAGLLLLAWGAADFDGLFTTFHRIAFTNDGWLLDPRTDLLIRLMPTGLFVSLGLRVLLPAAAAAAAAGIAGALLCRAGKNGHGTVPGPARPEKNGEA